MASILDIAVAIRDITVTNKGLAAIHKHCSYTHKAQLSKLLISAVFPKILVQFGGNYRNPSIRTGRNGQACC